LIEVTGKGNPTLQIRVATVDRKIEPSQRTYDAAYGKANSFAANNTSAANFDSSIVKEGLNKRIADNIREADKNIPGLDQPRELVRWAYQAKINDISKVFTFGDKFVIAKLTDIREKGILPLDAVREQVTVEARKQKKGEMLIEKMNATGAKSIDDMASKLNTAAMDADNVSFSSPFVPGLGNEPKLVGTAFGLKAGQLSKPVAGDNGVCVLFVKSFTEPTATTDFSSSGKQMADQRRARSEYEVLNALKESAGIEDNRGKFY
jgi:peptidyl-prolyl cis-trans isomerase D